MIQFQVLSKILQTKDPSLITLNNLNDEFFSDYKEEFNYIKDHINTYGIVPDITSFITKFPKFEIRTISEEDTYLLKELYADKEERHMANAFNDIRDAIMARDLDKAKLIFKESYDKIYSSTPITSIDITKDTSRYDKYIERLSDTNKYFISTGFKELDDIIGGWDREEEIAVFAARPGQSKSFCLLKSAVAALDQGLNVGFYSGEMSERKVGYRFDTLAGNIANGSLNHANDNIQVEYQRWISTLPERFVGSLKILTPRMIGGQATVSTLRAFIEKEKLDILFVDQYSLLEDERKGRSDVERFSNLSKDLKNLQVMTKIPIIAASQQNRTKNEDGVIDLTNIAQADRIGQDATTVIFLEKKEDTIKMHLVKSRDNEAGKILTYETNLNYGEFNYLPDIDENTEDEDKANALKNMFE